MCVNNNIHFARAMVWAVCQSGVLGFARVLFWSSIDFGLSNDVDQRNVARGFGGELGVGIFLFAHADPQGSYPVWGPCSSLRPKTHADQL